MFRKISPEEKLEQEGSATCENFRVCDKCRQCALHGAYKFCTEFKTKVSQLPTGGLF